jgi:hypothetical protein
MRRDVRPRRSGDRVTLNEFAFLALGLVLGVASGIALLLVVNARTPAVREIKLTVAPDALPRRRSATLSEDAFTNPAEPARGGPADRHQDVIDYLYDSPFDDRFDDPITRTIVRSAPQPPAGAGDPESSAPAPPIAMRQDERNGDMDFLTEDPVAAARVTGASVALPASIVASWPRRAARADPLVAVPVFSETDPTMAALRESAARTAERLMRHYAEAPTTVEHWDREESSVAIAVAEPVGGDAVGAVVGAAHAALSAAAVAAASGAAAVGAASGAAAVAAASGAAAVGAASLSAATRRGTTVSDPRSSTSDASTAVRADGPCDDLDRVADERCEVAHGARQRVETAQEALSELQRRYDEHMARAEEASTGADERAMRTAKEAAQLTFRGARAAAVTRDDVERAAREWLSEINRVNQAARDASVQLQRERQAAGELLPDLERLSVEADVARGAAEAADAACAAARAAADDCREANEREIADERARNFERLAVAEDDAVAADHLAAMDWDPSSPIAPDAPPAMRPSPATAPRSVPPAYRAAAIAPLLTDDEDSPLQGHGAREPAIVRLVRGDHATLEHLVNGLAGDNPAARRHWQLALAGFVDAIIATSIESSIMTFPREHPFWRDFSLAQNRDIAAALASLGFRFDGLGGWADDRVPSQRDLSLAVGYAGLDPMRIRRWPTDTETAALYRDVRVAADEFLVGAARGLTLGELVTALGRRADALTDVWNDWERVRPLLLDSA